MKRSTAREYLEALLVAAVFLGFTNIFVLKTFYIPSGSMKETLQIGDHLIVNRFIFGNHDAPAFLPHRGPRHGDVVIFRSPENPEVDLVKRLIGLPGDRIEMVEKTLYLNGEPVDDQAYAVHVDPKTGARVSGLTRRTNLRDLNPQLSRRDNIEGFTVPDGQFFFLGDNRDQSYDSRYWGTVPAHFIKGRAFLIYWSYGGETPDGTWQGYGEKVVHLLKTATGFLTKTRWMRTFRIVR